MHRSVKIQEYSGNIDQRLPDQEALLIQLCEHLFRSGFVYHDSTETEIEAGGSVICDFFDQEAELIRELIPRERFNGFNDIENWKKNVAGLGEAMRRFDWVNVIKFYDDKLEEIFSDAC